jgi:hypothetical protein
MRCLFSKKREGVSFISFRQAGSRSHSGWLAGQDTKKVTLKEYDEREVHNERKTESHHTLGIVIYEYSANALHTMKSTILLSYNRYIRSLSVRVAICKDKEVEKTKV